MAKQKHVNSIVPALQEASNYALVNALTQAGSKLKVVVLGTGYAPGLIRTPVWPTVQGDYFISPFRPFSLPNAGTRQMAAALHRYAGFKKRQFPTFSQYEAWLGADLMIKGLLRAGATPTRAGVVKALRRITAYNGDGILPITINYATVFGKDTPDCAWFLRAQTSGFFEVSARARCGHDLAGTTTVKSP